MGILQLNELSQNLLTHGMNSIDIQALFGQANKTDSLTPHKDSIQGRPSNTPTGSVVI
jgi:hypothetical protein